MKAKVWLGASPLAGAALVLALTMGVLVRSEKPAVAAGGQAATTGPRDDLYPPWWRGEEGTTLQHWTFDSDQSSGDWIPEDYDNPYGEPLIHMFLGGDAWYATWEGRSGVMYTSSNELQIHLPNSDEPLEWKIVWIQFTWMYQDGSFVAPRFSGSNPIGEIVEEQHEELEEGWWHTVYGIWIPENPDFEKLKFAVDHYFDQIVVDTWCTDVAPWGACCVGCECVDTTDCQECTDLGGWFYPGEDCLGASAFECPCKDALWHNGEPDFRQAMSCERRTDGSLESWVVDDVIFEEDVLVRDLHWWAVTDEEYDWQNADDIIILADDGGSPGEVLYELSEIYNTRYDTCQDMTSTSIYFYWLDGLEIELSAGTYWFGMRPVNYDTVGQSFHMTAAPNGTNECYFQSDYFGYPDWTASSEVWGEAYDIAFCVTSTPPTEKKDEQPLCCDNYMTFTNLNSLAYPNWMRYDDFICTQTGDITKIVFWGGGFDVEHGHACFPDLAAVRIDIHEWIEGGECGWQHGPLLARNTIPIEDLDPTFECEGPGGLLEYYRFTASLSETCYQTEGDHYVLMIAGILNDPEDPCIFGWVRTSELYNDAAYSYTPDGDDWECDGPDQAFILYTHIPGPCPWDYDGNGVVNTADLLFLLGAWGTPDGDVNGDGTTNTADLLELLGHWGDCP